MKPRITKSIKEVALVMDGLQKKFGLRFDYNSPDLGRFAEYIKSELKFVRKITPEKYQSDVIDITITRVYLANFTGI